MNRDATNTFSADAEPRTSPGAGYLPIWLTVLLGLLFYWGCNYVDRNGGSFEQLVYAPYISTNELAGLKPADETTIQIRQGEQIYGQYCAGCHQPQGGGAPGIAPPLAGSEWVHMSPSRVARIPLRGLQGPIKVKGAEFNLSMVAIGAAMTDDQIAAVLTYIRNSFGNKASRVTVADVAKVRAAIAGHPDQFTADEIMKVAE